MASKFLALATGLVVMAAGGAASACGQMGTVDHAQPGVKIMVRGYGYGFEGGDRPLRLVWASGQVVAATVRIDATGAFEVEIPAPTTPGTHELVALEGEDDPAPASVTVTVLTIGA
jgi:hypothetical protein